MGLQEFSSWILKKQHGFGKKNSQYKKGQNLGRATPEFFFIMGAPPPSELFFFLDPPLENNVLYNV